MRIPRILFTGDEEKDKDMFSTMNYLTNIVWQSERHSFQDCELIVEQILEKLVEEGFIKGGK